MKKPGDHIRINFGRHPFVFDIDGMMAQERQSVMNDIRKAESQNLHPPDDENTLVHNLIGQYLAHEGYIETARALAQDIHDRQQTLPNGSTSFQLPGAEDDVHAANRQKIRKSILDGDIDKALKYTHCFYPNVLKDERNRDINFRLQCRKFIEMMRRYTDLSAAATSSNVSKSVDSLGSNGHVDGGIEIRSEIERQEPADTQMELDDQLHRETSQDQEASPLAEDVDMDASVELPGKASLMKLDDLLAQAFAYGQQLRSTYGSDPRPQIKKQLVDMFAIMAYPDPTESVVAQLFDPQGRVQIAEDLNGAILGKSDCHPYRREDRVLMTRQSLLVSLPLRHWRSFQRRLKLCWMRLRVRLVVRQRSSVCSRISYRRNSSRNVQGRCKQGRR